MWNFNSKPDGILCNHLELKEVNKILISFTISVFSDTDIVGDPSVGKV